MHLDFLTAFEIGEKCSHFKSYFYIKGILLPHIKKAKLQLVKYI